MLATGGAVLALVLATLAGGVAVPSTVTVGHLAPAEAGVHLARAEATSCEGSEQRPVCVQPRSFTSDEWATAVGSPSTFQLQQGFSPRGGRPGFQPDPQTVHRAVRERQEALVTAHTRVMRAPGMPISAGYQADRPPVVTRPLRGPPARA